MAGQQPGLRNKVTSARIDEQQIGIMTDRNRSLPSLEAEASRHIGSGQLGHQSPVQPCSEERADKLLRAHDAAPNSKKVIALLHGRGTRRVIRAERFDIAALDACDHLRPRRFAA